MEWVVENEGGQARRKALMGKQLGIGNRQYTDFHRTCRPLLLSPAYRACFYVDGR